MKKLLPILALVFFSACGGGRIFLADSEEYFAGRATASEILVNNPRVADDELQLYVNLVGYSIALVSERPEIFYGWTFVVIDSEQINAVSCGGGIILVTKGLVRFCETEDELAGLIAHEIAHTALYHPEMAYDRQIAAAEGWEKFQEGREWVKEAASWLGIGAGILSRMLGGRGGGTASTVSKAARMAEATAAATVVLAGISEVMDPIFKSWVDNVYRKGFERQQEYDADLRAAYYVTRPEVGYDPRGLANLLQRLADRGLAGDAAGGLFNSSTHPNPQARVDALHQYILDQGYAGTTDPKRTERFRRKTSSIR